MKSIDGGHVIGDGNGAPAEEDPVRALGRRIDAARRRRGWTYREFAERTGMSKSTLQYLIRTRRSAPDYFELKALVDRLGLPWTDEWQQLWQRAAALGEP